MNLSFAVPPGQGLVFAAPEDLQTAIKSGISVKVECLSFYNGSDDIFFQVRHQNIESVLERLNESGQYEVSLRGTLSIEPGPHARVLESSNGGNGFDYAVYFVSEDGKEWWSGDDWEFIENRNVQVTV